MSVLVALGSSYRNPIFSGVVMLVLLGLILYLGVTDDRG